MQARRDSRGNNTFPAQNIGMVLLNKLPSNEKLSDIQLKIK